MNALTKFAAAAASIVAFSAAASTSQAAVYIGLQQAGVNGGAITTVDVDPATAVFNGSYGSYEVNLVTGSDAVFPVLFGSTDNTHSSTGGAGTIDVWVTLTDVTEVDGLTHFLTSFGISQLNPGYTLTSYSYVDTSNSVYGTETLLAQHTFTTTGAGLDIGKAVDVGAGPFSITTRYTVTGSGTGGAFGTIGVAAVPEPGTWALMIMGFGGAGAMLRSRRRALVAA